MLRAVLCLASSLLLAAPFGMSQAPDDGDAPPPPGGEPVQLLTERDGTMLHLRGVFTGQPDVSGELRYQLTVKKEGSAGRSTSRQGGALEAPAPGVADTLSRVQIGVEVGDHVGATLTVHRASQLVGEARLDTVLQQ